MAEGTYEYECMRAELLGIEKPNYEEWVKNKEEERAVVEEEERDTEHLKEVENESEQKKRIAGGLEELNSILKSTQRRINRFKASCGSLTDLIKLKIGGGSTGAIDHSATSETNGATIPETAPPAEVGGGGGGNSARKSDLTRALDDHHDRLDSLIEKAENSQYAMAHQNKEMKRYLR